MPAHQCIVADVRRDSIRDLDEQGQRLLALLVERLKDVVPGNPATYVGYQAVHERLGLRLLGRTYGESLKHQGLSSLANWTQSEQKPGIPGIIIDQTTLMPGEGYFRLFGKEPTDFVWWQTQVQLSKEFNWIEYLPASAIPESPNAADIGEPASRQESTVYRILRDTLPARRVKLFHEYRCQLCGYAICLSDGSLYAEAHHIRPLGEPHNGPDVRENIVCLCPNHHAELDYGARPLRIEELSVVPSHSVGEEYVRYHNEVVYHRERGA